MKRFLQIAITAAALLLAALPEKATAGLQPDGTLNGGTNNVAALTTNTYAGTVFAVNQTSDATFEFTFTSTTNSALVNATVYWDASINQDIWQSNVLIQVIPLNVTISNWCIGLTNPSRPFPFWRVGRVANTNAVSWYYSNMAARVFTKTGI